MKLYLTLLLFATAITLCTGQINKTQLALDVSNAEFANMQKMKSFIWNRSSTATVDGEVKATLVNQLSFDSKGDLQVTQISGNTTVKKKRGIRGRIQESSIDKSMEYVSDALALGLKYMYMSKGQLLDFYDKATISEANGIISATASNVFMNGDNMTILVDAATNLYVKKTFSTLLESDPVDGVVTYEKFSSGINHVAETVLKLPAKKTVIDAKNIDYSQRVN
jgi:hypothetical protein